MISEAVWWVTIVDATLMRYRPGVYSGVLDLDDASALLAEERALWGFAAADVNLVALPQTTDVALTDEIRQGIERRILQQEEQLSRRLDQLDSIRERLQRGRPRRRVFRPGYPRAGRCARGHRRQRRRPHLRDR